MVKMGKKHFNDNETETTLKNSGKSTLYGETNNNLCPGWVFWEFFSFVVYYFALTRNHYMIIAGTTLAILIFGIATDCAKR